MKGSSLAILQEERKQSTSEDMEERNSFPRLEEG